MNRRWKVGAMRGVWAASCCIAIAAAGGTVVGGAAHAQGKQSEVAWVKVCKKTEVTHIPKDAKQKPTKQMKEICRTRYEQLAPFAAMSVQVQEIKGVDELGLIISFSLPQQMAIKPGILAAVYSASQWKDVQAKKEVDKKDLKILRVGYTRCGPGSCSAEVPAPKELIGDMRKGAVMLVKAFRGDGQVVEVPISLAGFSKVLDGKPTDLAAYEQARAQALKALSARRNQILAEERARRSGANIPEPKAVVKQ
jgi:invasion protein IalB